MAVQEEVLETKVRLPSKPVVIGDALPVPAQCPDSVEQLLEASLAHHNLGKLLAACYNRIFCSVYVGFCVANGVVDVSV
jgi:hypothetical protein